MIMSKWHKKGNRILAALLIAVIFILSAAISEKQAFAAESEDYILDGTVRVPIPKTYVLKKVINNIGSAGKETGYLKKPGDIFINSQGYIFITDTGNNRIIKMTKEGTTLNIFKGPKQKPLNSPGGVFADDDGNMYIADTGNGRIVHLSAGGEFVEEFVKPDSNLFESTFTFQPTKVCISPTGYIYSIGNQSVMLMDAYNRFRGFWGQTNVGFNIVEALVRKFASNQQKKYIVKRNPAAFINIAMDEQGMTYVTTADATEGEIKKLNSVGENIYRKYGSVSNSLNLFNLDFLTKMNMTDKTFVYGERFDDDGKPIKPYFVDLAVDKAGNVSAIERNTCKIYQYDQEGNLLTVFGGKGDQKGSFDLPSSIAVDNDGNIYELDMSKNNIQIFEPTDFIKLVHQAVKMYSEGNYDAAYNVWNKVLKIDENYDMAHTGIAKTFYKQKRYKESMQEYVYANDRNGYSMAYTKYRHDIFRQYFGLIVLGIISVIIFFSLAIKFLKKMARNALTEFRMLNPNRMRLANLFKLSIATLFHPIEAFDYVKSSRHKLNYMPSIIILLLVVAVRIFYIYTVHYPLADIDIKDANIVLEVVKLILPIITWVVASFAITAILDGESTFGEIFVVTSFCMIPYLLINIPLPVLSNVFARSESTLYGFILNATNIWILILIFLSVKNMNNFSIGKTIGVCILSVATMALLWAITLLIFVLVGELYLFILGLVREVQMILL